MTHHLGTIAWLVLLGQHQPVGGEATCLSNITQVTNQKMGLFNAGEAYFSPDARTIIFQATPVGADEYQIYTLDLQSRKLKMVSTGKGACTCAFFHPSGTKIIFASSHLDPNLGQPKEKDDSGGYQWDFNEHMDIFEANPDGTNLRRLTHAPGYDAEGAYSSDGKKIVFTSERDGDLEIYVMNADGTHPTRITRTKGYDGGPFFSPSGKQIIYRGDHRSDDKMNLQLRIVNADGTDDHALTDNPIFNWCPFWHPFGKSLIFTQTDHEAWSKGKKPNYDLFLISPRGTDLTRVTYATEFDGLPVFSPNGKQLLWTSKRSGLDEPQIFIADFKLPKKFE